ncbi:hypothetical protein PAXINDRAFT_136387 [Paxillus involutus ATCC 200175]|uniref:DUF453-domain-containing protein n=1 Tax=Paxillus involutus ATCC 200175 TaxID=664439 RepID=A0A0C9TRW8_PAXIN|nr:hypothetical protein PAXINDRAFT_136387 [Paxillus involutus ATCC 200175]
MLQALSSRRFAVPSSCLRLRSIQRLASVTPNPIPATFLRGGTSKGIFLNRDHLPEDRSQWALICLGIMGSPDTANGLQINGMGGGISSLSKICVVGAPSESQKAQGLDAEYTFIQVGIRDSTVDFSGNCGNLSSMVGAFALQEGICSRDGSPVETTTRVHNTNTNSHIHTTFPVTSVSGRVVPKLDLAQTTVAGVPGKASQIILEFPKPAGALTGKLLPTGTPVDIIDVHVRPGTRVPVSLVDATNPTVFITLSDLTHILNLPPQSNVDFSNETVRELVESIRTQSAVKMGLDPSAQAQPKVAVISPPAAEDHDIYIQAYSMGVPHKAVPMTVGLCLGVAANIEGSLVQKTARGLESGASSRGLLTMKHSSGFVEVGAEFEVDGSVKSARTVRTGRWLMRGAVYW